MSSPKRKIKGKSSKPSLSGSENSKQSESGKKSHKKKGSKTKLKKIKSQEQPVMSSTLEGSKKAQTTIEPIGPPALASFNNLSVFDVYLASQKADNHDPDKFPPIPNLPAPKEEEQVFNVVDPEGNRLYIIYRDGRVNATEKEENARKVMEKRGGCCKGGGRPKKGVLETKRFLHIYDNSGQLIITGETSNLFPSVVIQSVGDSMLGKVVDGNLTVGKLKIQDQYRPYYPLEDAEKNYIFVLTPWRKKDEQQKQQKSSEKLSESLALFDELTVNYSTTANGRPPREMVGRRDVYLKILKENQISGNFPVEWDPIFKVLVFCALLTLKLGPDTSDIYWYF